MRKERATYASCRRQPADTTPVRSSDRDERDCAARDRADNSDRGGAIVRRSRRRSTPMSRVAQRCEDVTAPVTVGEAARATSQFTPQRPWHTSKRDVDGLCRRHRCCWKSRQRRSTPSRRLQRLRRWTDWPRSRTLVPGWAGVFPGEPDGLGSITVTETSLSPNLVGVYVATARPTDVQACKEHLTVGHVGRRIAACWRPLNRHSMRPKPLGTSRNGGSAARQRRLGGDG